MFDWITSTVQTTGYPGIALLMFVENVFPPIPSEIIMPLAGFTAAQGQVNIFLVILAGSIGSLAGALLWYYIGRWLGQERIKKRAAKHGRWFTLTPDEVDQAFEFFQRHEGKAVFFGRLMPTIRTLISVPAGIANMPLWSFLAYSAAGTALWTALLATAGYFLQSQYESVSNWLNPVSNVIIGFIVIFYIYRVVTFDAGKKAKSSS